MNLAKKIGIAAGALTLGATGIAVAAGPPPAAEGGLTNASEHVGVELPASKDAHPADDHADDAPDSESEDAADEIDDEGIGPVDNHGAEVSAVAKSDETTGREHGMAVSEVARQGHGRGPSEDNPAEQP